MLNTEKLIDNTTINQYTLVFTKNSKPLESIYRENYSKQYISQIRMTLIVSAIFVFLSYFTYKPQTDALFQYAALIRFYILIPLLAVVFFLTFRDWFYKYLQISLSALILVCGIGILHLMLMTPLPYNITYFSGIILVILFGYTIFRVRFVYSTFTGWGLFLITILVSATRLDLAPDMLGIYAFCMAVANIIGMISCYNFEYTSRFDFLLKYRLAQEKENITINNKKLEQSVQINMEELTRTIQKLETEIAERQEAEKKIAKLATLDSLTTLPNRTLFSEHLSQAIERAQNKDTSMAVLLFDLDNFKTINEVFSHQYGDKLLVQTAERLRSCMRETDVISRLGEDEFVILIENLKHLNQVTVVAEKILDTISKPFQLDSQEVFITASMGISIYPDNGKTSGILLNNADSALYSAKLLGKNNYQFSSPEMTKKSIERINLGVNLKLALERDEFIIHYQPQVNLINHNIIGIEALLRWNKSDKGLIFPDQIIPIAEETGLIIPIGEWVIKTACEQLKTWEKKGLPLTRVSINLSSRQLRQPERLVSFIREVLEETKLDPQWLELELTENIVFQHIDNIMDILNKMNKLGIRLAIDDFGAGYSTLGQLAHLPFNTLKIDRSFAVNLENSTNDAAVAAGIISIAQKLGKQIVAEGIETQYQIDFYKAQGCHIIQGWYFSKAVPPYQIEEYLRNGLPG